MDRTSGIKHTERTCFYYDDNNALIVSMEALEEALGLSRSTLDKAIKYLEENKWLVIRKLDTSNVYTINSEIA